MIIAYYGLLGSAGLGGFYTCLLVVVFCGHFSFKQEGGRERGRLICILTGRGYFTSPSLNYQSNLTSGWGPPNTRIENKYEEWNVTSEANTTM